MGSATVAVFALALARVAYLQRQEALIQRSASQTQRNAAETERNAAIKQRQITQELRQQTQKTKSGLLASAANGEFTSHRIGNAALLALEAS